jgi:hypothetical protein
MSVRVHSYIVLIRPVMRSFVLVVTDSARSTQALLCQKLLESYPLSGLVMINPLPPDISTLGNSYLWEYLILCVRGSGSLLEDIHMWVADGWIHSLMRHSSITPIADDGQATVQSMTALLSRLLTQSALTRDLLGIQQLEPDDADAVEVTLEEVVVSGRDGTDADNLKLKAAYCGVSAAAAYLSLLSANPLNLEPQPVPMEVMHAMLGSFVDVETVSCEAVLF